MEKQKDVHLEAPGEANTDKHINFLAEERDNSDETDKLFDTSEGSKYRRS